MLDDSDSSWILEMTSLTICSVSDSDDDDDVTGLGAGDATCVHIQRLLSKMNSKSTNDIGFREMFVLISGFNLMF